jgi:hypothetical protein
MTTTRYVNNTTGFDSNAGTFAAPKATIQSAHDACTDGDIVIVQSTAAQASATITLAVGTIDYVGSGDVISLISTDGTTITCTLGGVGSTTTSSSTAGNVTAATYASGTDNTLQATAQAVSIATAINSNTRFIATNSANVVTVTQAMTGTTGNTTVTITELGMTGMAKTDFTGGLNGYDLTAEAPTAAAATDALKITGGTVYHNDAFTVLVPANAGGLAGDVTITVLARTSMGSTPSANQIHWHLTGDDANKIANLKSAINGTADTSKVKFGSGITSGTTVGIKGLTASNGVASVESYASLTADNGGTAGNDIALTDTVGSVLVNESALASGKLAGGVLGTSTPTITKSIKLLGQGHDLPNTDYSYVSSVPELRASRITQAGDWSLDGSDFSEGTLYYYSNVTSDTNYKPLTVFDDSISGIDKRAERVTTSSSVSSGKMWWDATNRRIYYRTSSDLTSSPSVNPGSVGVRVPIAASAITVSANFVEIEGFKISEWGVSGIRIGDPTASTPTESTVHTGISITNCLFSQGVGPAIWASSFRSQFDRNRFRFVGQPARSGDYYAAEQSGIYKGSISIIHGAANRVSGNDFNEIGGACVRLDTPDGDNVISENVMSKLYLGTSEGAVSVINKSSINQTGNNYDFIVKNTIDTCSRAIYLDGTNHVVVSKNTMYNCQEVLKLGKSLGSSGTYPENCSISGNLISETGSESPANSSDTWYTLLTALSLDGNNVNEGHVEFSGTLSATEEISLKSINWRGNTYHRSTGVPRFRWGELFRAFGSWPTHSFNYDSDSIIGSPGFVNASSGDFHLSESSTAIGGVYPLNSFFNSDSSNVAHINISNSVGTSSSDRGAYDFEDTEFNSQDLFLFLTGNVQSSDRVSNRNPASSLGGEDNDTTYAHAVDNLNIFRHLSGDDLNSGVSDYRAVDIANLCIQPSATQSGSGTLLENFNTTTGVLINPNLSVSSSTPSKSSAVQLALDFESPTVTIATETTTPGLTFSTSPSQSPESDIEPKTDGTPPEVLRLWLKRTINSGTTFRNGDSGELTIGGTASSVGLV